MSKILVVEDEESIRALIAMNLAAAGFATEEAEHGAQALECIHAQRPDLILLDWMMPGMSGLKLLRTLKADPELTSIPVIMLTAKSEEHDIVLGLEEGAADYITKPFSNKVLVARVRAVLRREAEHLQDAVIRYNDLQLFPEQRKALLADEPLTLTCGEFDLLALLCERPGRVYTRGQIVARTKGEDYPVTDRAVDVQVVTLRRKLGPYGEYLETVRGVGYRMRG